MKKTFEHWVAINFLNMVSLVVLDKEDHTKWYWNGTPTWCSTCNGSSPDIVKDYGMIDTMDEESIKDIEFDFYKTFYNPKKSKPFISGGWISPDGDFYPCKYFEHDSLATALSHIYYPESTSHGVYSLDTKGWIHLSAEGYPLGNKPTQKQLDILFDIANSDNYLEEDYDEESKKHFKDCILNYIKIITL